MTTVYVPVTMTARHSSALPYLAAVALLLIILQVGWNSSSESGADDGKIRESEGSAPPSEGGAGGPPTASRANHGNKKLDPKTAAACARPLPDSDQSSEDEPEPPIVTNATPGERVRMEPYQTAEGGSMEYQLFLPADWSDSDKERTYPVVVFLHGAGDGKFSVMNSQSLPRLLSEDQSTSFDDRKCWCLDSEYEAAEAMKENLSPEDNADAAFVGYPSNGETEELWSPMADCDFASHFGAIVVMPQGWLPDHPTGWRDRELTNVVALTSHVMDKYRGDPRLVVLTGQSAGGKGAWDFAASRPELWSAVNVICAPWGFRGPAMADALEGKPIWVVGWVGDGQMGNDDAVVALKKRRDGGGDKTRYTRYTKAPGPPDPKYRSMLHHASYDLIYRDPRLWEWAFGEDMVCDDCAKEWGKVK